MDVITSPEALRTIVAKRRLEGLRIGFVPTMGALHAGHLSLIDVARSNCDFVIVSAFVNPLQFDDPRDFALYPDTRETDERMCREHSVDVLYRPSAESMYPTGFATSIHVAGLSEVVEGASRPGHFDGVATVVAKLLLAADPDIAVFGAKDFQQVAVIERMVSDLGIPVRIVVAPTVREGDGLAMSSRNVRLDDRARTSATGIYRGLQAACQAFDKGTSDSSRLIDIVVGHISSSNLVEIDYVRIVDPDSLEDVTMAESGDVVLIAAIVGGVRLIDNAVLIRVD